MRSGRRKDDGRRCRRAEIQNLSSLWVAKGGDRQQGSSRRGQTEMEAVLL